MRTVIPEYAVLIPPKADLVFKADLFDVYQAEPAHDSGEKISIKLVDFDEALVLANSPKNRHLPREILASVGSIEGLKTLPEVV